MKNDFLRQFAFGNPTITPRIVTPPRPTVLSTSLPRHTLRYALRRGALTQLVIQVDAQVWPFKVFAHHSYLHDVRLAIPYVILVPELMRYGNGSQVVNAYAFYRNAPLQSVNDDVYQTNFPNILHGEVICLGMQHELQASMAQSASDAECARLFVDDFVHRPFSDHSMHRFFDSKQLHNAFSSFADWEALSRRDPNFVLRVPWRYVGRLDDLLQRSQGALFL